MSFPSAAIWNCKSGFGICLRHTTTFRATANARRKRTLFQASQSRIGEVDFYSVRGSIGTGGERSIVQSPWKSGGTPDERNGTPTAVGRGPTPDAVSADVASL